LQKADRGILYDALAAAGGIKNPPTQQGRRGKVQASRFVFSFVQRFNDFLASSSEKRGIV
jgi:hypothetical protein